MESFITPQHKITPCLWFDNQAEEAVNFYTSIFKNSKVGKIALYEDDVRMPKGTVMTASFEILGQEFVALNGGPVFKFSHAISFIINCNTQEEIDEYWEKLSEGGTKEQCGWVKDKYGISWQVIPVILSELLVSGNRKKASSVMDSILKMKKIVISELKEAFESVE